MNILDYVIWRGDITLDTDPFNEVDNLLFSQLTYLDINGLTKESDVFNLNELYSIYINNHSEEEINKLNVNNKFAFDLLKVMAVSNRFKYCKIKNYVSIKHNNPAEQFCGMMFELNDNSTVVAFRGTDDSIVGWKEDLILSYSDIKSQEDAVNYINNYCKGINKLRLVGHSKAGNLVLYAAVHCDLDIQDKIIEVYSNDGPGLRPSSYDVDRYGQIKDRCKLIVPEKDGVGTIYEMIENKKIVKVSTKNIIYAHYLYTWQIIANHIEEADNEQYETDLSRSSIIYFLNETDEKQREFFVNELFNSFEQAGIVSLNQIRVSGLPVIIKALKEMAEMDDKAKQVAFKMFEAFGTNIQDDLQNEINNAKNEILNSVNSISNKFQEMIKKKN